MKRKILTLLALTLTLTLSLFFVACGGGDNGGNSGGSNPPASDNGGEENGGSNQDSHVCSFDGFRLVAPTCSSEGYDEKSCTCGEVVKENYTPRIAHTIEAGVCTVCSNAVSDIRLVKITGKDEYSVRGLGSFTGTEIIIPNEYNGMPVTDINASAFKGKLITSVYIPASVKVIGKQAFSGCINLTSVSIESGSALESVGLDAFEECSNLLLTNVDGSGYLGDATSPVVLIKGDTEKAQVTINSSCRVIYQKAFENNAVISEVTIPASIQNIGESAFYKCNNVKKVNYGGTTTEWADIDFDDIYSTPAYYAGSAYVNGAPITEVSYTGAKVNDYAFAGFTSIEKAVLDVVEIGVQAFYNATFLKQLELSKNLTTIGTSAFEYCETLIEIKNDSKIVIEAGVTDRSNGCVGTHAINIYSTSKGRSRISTDSDGNVYLTSGTNVYLVKTSGTTKDFVVPSNVTHILQYAFYQNTVLETIDLSGKLEEIGDKAFSKCTSLKAIHIPANITIIGNEAFRGCVSVKTLTFEQEKSFLQEFGDYAFSELPLVTSIILPDGLKLMGEYSFAYCEELIEFSMPGTLDRLGYRIIHGCMKLKSAEFRGTGFMEMTMQPVHNRPNELYFFYWYYLSGLEWCHTYGGSWQVEPHGR
ncbi:MAG: leucine-rich repeat protein [Clostridia bacterium]|nr:leucine-rich repeat protein [Clostridia bacterium]